MFLQKSVVAPPKYSGEPAAGSLQASCILLGKRLHYRNSPCMVGYLSSNLFAIVKTLLGSRTQATWPFELRFAPGDFNSCTYAFHRAVALCISAYLNRDSLALVFFSSPAFFASRLSREISFKVSISTAGSRISSSFSILPIDFTFSDFASMVL